MILTICCRTNQRLHLLKKADAIMSSFSHGSRSGSSTVHNEQWCNCDVAYSGLRGQTSGSFKFFRDQLCVNSMCGRYLSDDKEETTDFRHGQDKESSWS